MRSQTVAAVDIGTNTLKFTVAICHSDGRVESLLDLSETVRIGAGIESTGRIDDERAERALATLVSFEQAGRDHGATAFIGVATEALRIAENGSVVLARISSETRWVIDVITGDEEARLTFVGLQSRLPVQGTASIVDIGGGSTEWVTARDRNLVTSRSIPIGSGRLADRFFTTDPPTRVALTLATSAAREVFAKEFVEADIKVDALKLSGGNGQYLDLLREVFDIGPALTAQTIEQALEILSQEPAERIVAALGVQLERARVIPAGVAIALAAIQIARPDTIEAVPSGIRAGLLQEYGERHHSDA